MSLSLQIAKQDFASKINDPRADLAGDSNQWIDFLTLARKIYGDEFYYLMHGFRCCGLRIRTSEKGYILRPEVDPEGRIGFYPDEYEGMRDKYLLKQVDKIKYLLSVLRTGGN